MPPSTPKASDASESDDAPQSSGTKPPTVRPAIAQRPITERLTGKRSALVAVSLRVSRTAGSGGDPEIVTVGIAEPKVFQAPAVHLELEPQDVCVEVDEAVEVGGEELDSEGHAVCHSRTRVWAEPRGA